MNLVREILLTMEAEEHAIYQGPLSVEGYTDDQVGYHAYLMIQAGLIEGPTVTSLAALSPSVMPQIVTWQGHELLDSIRHRDVWTKITAAVKSKGAALSFEVIKAMAVRYLKESIGGAE